MKTLRLVVTINVVVVALCFVGFEFWLRSQSKPTHNLGKETPVSRVENLWDDAYRQLDPDLGVAPVPGVVRENVRKFYGDKLIYDVTYTINQRGWRATGTEQFGKEATDCVVFFGGSFTFGEGVEDAEATPTLVSKLLGDRFRVFNLGFHGYGAHQMLGAIETGRIPESSECPGKTFVFYSFISDHVKRAFRFYPSPQGPEYQPTGDFDVERVGSLENPEGTLEKIQGLETVRRIRSKTIDRIDLDRMVGIVNRSRQLLRERYPEMTFRMMLWSYHIEQGFNFHDEFAKIGLTMHSIPDRYRTKGRKTSWEHWVLPHDGHPNPAAHRKAAELVVELVNSEAE